MVRSAHLLEFSRITLLLAGVAAIFSGPILSAQTGPAISVTCGETVEGQDPAAAPQVEFQLTVSSAQPVDTVWEYVSVPDTAREVADYLPVRGNVTIPAGEVSATVRVTLVPDTVKESSETFGLVVWPRGGVPEPVFTRLPVTWPDAYGLSAVSEGSWYNQWAVGGPGGAFRYFRDNRAREDTPPALSGRWLVWDEIIYPTATEKKHRILNFADREREGMPAWATVGRLPLLNAKLPEIAGDLVAASTAAGVAVVRMHAHNAPQEEARLPIAGKIDYLSFSGNRLAVAAARRIQIFKAPRETAGPWEWEAEIFSPWDTISGPLTLDGDTLIAHTVDKNGFPIEMRAYSKGTAGWTQTWRFSGPPNLPDPRTIKGGLSLTYKTGTASAIHVQTRNPADLSWTEEGAFLCPTTDNPPHTFADMKLGGRNVLICAAHPGQSLNVLWLGAFPGATAVIVDDDIPVISLAQPTGFEPDQGSEALQGNFILSHESSAAVTVHWTTESGSARAGSDFDAVSGQSTIPVGALTAPISVPVRADDEAEPAERLNIRITSVTGATCLTDSIPWTILDRDRRPAIVFADAARPADFLPEVVQVRENLPAVRAVVKYTSVSSPFSLGLHSVAAVFGDGNQPAADYGYADSAEDYSFTATELSVTASGERPLSLTARDDAAVEATEQALLGFSLPASAVAASFSDRLVDRTTAAPPAGYRLDSGATDGEWAVVRGGVAPLGDPKLFFYRRSAEAAGAWRPAGSLSGRFTYGHIALASGRLAIRGQNQAWFFKPGGGETPVWELEGQCYFPDSSGGAAFDGESLVAAHEVVAEESYQYRSLLNIVSRRGGSWGQLQTIDLATYSYSRYDRLPVALDGGRIVCQGGHGQFGQDLSVVEKTGPEWAPWRIVGSIPVTIPYGRRIALKNDLLAVIGDYDIGFFRFDDAGSWRSEETFRDEFMAMSADVLICRTNTYARNNTGGETGLWRVLGRTPNHVAAASGSTFDFNQGVLTVTEAAASGRPAVFRILEGGLGYDILDEDSYTLRAAAGNDWREPQSSPLSATVNVTASSGLSRPPIELVIPFQTVPGGSAIPGEDYVPVEGMLRIPPGGEVATLRIPLLPDGLSEDAETVIIQFGPPNFGAMESTRLTVTLQDDTSRVSAPFPAWAVPEPLVGESTVTVPFRLNKPHVNDVSAAYTVEALTAGAADLRVVSRGTVLIPAGSIAVPIPVTVLADTIAESSEDFKISIVSLGAALLTPVTAVVTIHDSATGGKTQDVFTTAQGQPLPSDPSRNVLANDFPGAAAAVAVNKTRNGGLILSPAGTFQYTPISPNFIGVDSFAYQTTGAGDPFQAPTPILWKWLHPLNGQDPGTTLPGFQSNWFTAGFDDTSWREGSLLMGYGVIGAGAGEPINTPLGTPPSGQRYSAYFRTKFTAPPSTPAGLTVQFSCDDAAIFYLNGSELGRFAPEPLGTFQTLPDSYKLLCPGFVDGAAEGETRTLVFPEARMLPGENMFAVSLHNQIPTSSDLSLHVKAIHAGAPPAPAWALIEVADAGLPPVVSNDRATLSTAAPPARLDSRLILFSLYHNDGLLDRSGKAFDPILEVEVSDASAVGVTVNAETGYFLIDSAPGVFGDVSFRYRVRDKDGWSNTADVTCAIQSTRPYENWIGGYFQGSAEPGRAAPEQDPDHDGVPNLLEFALGMNPLSDGKIPPLSLTKVGGEWTLTFSGTRDYGRDLILSVETSANLSGRDWLPLAELNDYTPYLNKIQPGLTLTQTPSFYRTDYVLSIPEALHSKGFFRLRARRDFHLP